MKTCDNCGSKVLSLGCVNCDEQNYIDEQNEALRKDDLLSTMELLKSGYAGCNPNGNIVDRREFPNAVPMQENLMFNTPKPKEL